MIRTTIRPMVTAFGAAPSPTTPADDASSPAPPPGVEMRGRTPRSTNTVRGWVAVCFGLPFVGAGLAVAALLAGKIGIAEGGRLEMPRAVVASIGVTFAIAGLALVAAGVQELVRRAAMPALRLRYAGQPWMWDYAWERRAGRDELVGEIGRALWVSAFVTLFLVPFHWVAFYSPERPVVFQIVTLLFDLFVAAILGQAGYRTLRLLRYGRSRLRFPSFPLRPGRDAVLDLTALSPRARRYPIVATLRCVQERYETRRSGRETSRVTVCYEVHRDERTVAPGEPTVRFPLAVGAPSTALDAHPPRYWELELRADGVPGVDYGARFLVPVY